MSTSESSWTPELAIHRMPSGLQRSLHLPSDPALHSPPSSPFSRLLDRVYLQQQLNDLGVPYESEETLRAQGMARTPDVLLHVPILVDGFPIHWIDSKAMFGDPHTHAAQTYKQYLGECSVWLAQREMSRVLFCVTQCSGQLAAPQRPLLSCSLFSPRRLREPLRPGPRHLLVWLRRRTQSLPRLSARGLARFRARRPALPLRPILTRRHHWPQAWESPGVPPPPPAAAAARIPARRSSSSGRVCCSCNSDLGRWCRTLCYLLPHAGLCVCAPRACGNAAGRGYRRSAWSGPRALRQAPALR